MAIVLLVAGLRRVKLQPETTCRPQRLMCSFRPSISAAAEGSEELNPNTKDNIRSKIFKLKYPQGNPTNLLRNWVGQGHRLSFPELRRITVQLLKSKRYNHVLEIFNWMETQSNFKISPADHAIRVESIIKVKGLKEAEDYFGHLPDGASRKAAYLPLLHGHVKERDTKKAEALMRKLSGLGLIVSSDPYNEMMKLYMGTSQFEKVLLVVQQMKKNRIPLNVLSYNLWMNACEEVNGVAHVEMVFKEMMRNSNIEVGWSTLCTIANVYVKAGIVDRANWALKNAENKLSSNKLLGYFFLITMYASLKNKEEVLRLWKASKAIYGRLTCANYMCILSCLVKMDEIVEAERVFTEWESNCRNYDIRVSNVLLGAYMRSGLVDKAELLHLRTLERGGCPNYKTCEILLEGWIKRKNMDKAIDAMKQGLSMLKHCEWRPSHDIVMTIADYFEKKRNVEDAFSYVKGIHDLGFASLPLYKSLLRILLSAQKPAFDVISMMEDDKILMDDETCALVQAFNM